MNIIAIWLVLVRTKPTLVVIYIYPHSSHVFWFFEWAHVNSTFLGRDSLPFVLIKWHVHSKHDNQDGDKMNTLAFIDFYSSKFSQPWFVKIFHRQNFVPYCIWLKQLVHLVGWNFGCHKTYYFKTKLVLQVEQTT